MDGRWQDFPLWEAPCPVASSRGCQSAQTWERTERARGGGSDPRAPAGQKKTSKNYENFKWKIFLFSLGSSFGSEMRQHSWSFGSLPIHQGFTQITRSSWFANLNNRTMLTKQTCQNCFCWYWNNLLGVHRSWRCQLFRDIRAKGLFMLHLEDCCICSHNLLLSFSWKLSCWWLQKEDLAKA